MMYIATETESDTLPTNEGIMTKHNYTQYKTFINPHNMQIYKYEFHTIKLYLAATSFIKPPLYSDHFKYLGPKLHYCKNLISK